ncbi:MAG: glycosyltransferase family 4 protein [Flavobacteriales bacterium]|nr:glycosyltransferase family 4 protein [Flavobacteriales bacterium]
MRILFLTDGITPFVMGGMQRHSENLCKALMPLVNHLTVAHCVYNQKIPAEWEVKEKWKIQSEKLKILGFLFPQGDSYPGHYIRCSKHYSKLLFEKFKTDLGEYDFIYAQGFTSYYFVKVKDKYSLPPLISNLHGLNMFQKTFGIRNWLESVLLKPIAKECLMGSDYVVSLGGKLSDLLINLGIPKEKILIAPNGVDASWLIDKDQIKALDEVTHFVFIGRDDKVKGLSNLLNVFTNISSKNIKLTIIGPVSEQPLDHVEFLGEIKNKEDIIAVLDSSDIVLCPSFSEGMPTVVLEAMSRGLAVIASDVGATSELVDSQNGWLFKPGNNLELRQAILDASTKDLIQFKRASREKIEDFIFARLASDFLNILAFRIDSKS